MSSIKDKANILANYSKDLNDFHIASELDTYTNMGAIIIDASLQAGIRYKTTVKPRIIAFLSEYSHLTKTSEFKNLIEKKKISEIINWKDNSKKTNLIINLTIFLIEEKIETQNEFYEWLSHKKNIIKIKNISGIGDKTADYLKILTGHKTNAIDRHLIKFMRNAGLNVKDYSEASNIISITSDILNIDEALYDHSIWLYMSD